MNKVDLKEIIIEHLGVNEDDLYFNDPLNYHMCLGDAMEIARIYADAKLIEAIKNINSITECGSILPGRKIFIEKNTGG